jgi:hypothetical protein
MEIKHSTFSKNRQMGIEARKGGRVIAVDNVITKTFPPNLAHIAAYPTSPLITSPSSMLKSSVFLQPIGVIQPLPPVQSG